MFWASARKRYQGVSSDDADIRKFLDLANNFQTDIYGGVTGIIQDIGHRWIAKRTPQGNVLEIGFGAGRHSLFYSGNAKNYFASEYSSAHLKSPLWNKFRGRILRCDARRLPFPTGSFDAVISIYNLEHIVDLQLVFREVYRVLAPRGKFLIALPCEGGLLWNLGRQLTSRRMFKKKYGINYDKVIAFEHVWDLNGVLAEMEKSGRFITEVKRLFPFMLPSSNLNLIACLRCAKRETR